MGSGVTITKKIQISSTMKKIKKANFSSFLGLLTAKFLLLSLFAPPVLAVDRLMLRLGPFQQSVNIADLDRFAKTGELSSALKPFSFLLTPNLRDALSQRLQIDPNLTDRYLQNWLGSPMSEQLLRNLRRTIPGVSVEQLQAAVAIAARQANGLNLIGVLRAIPGDTITLDATEAIALALQFNPSYWESQALGPLLKQELSVPSGEFRADFDPSTTGENRVWKETIALEDRMRDRAIPVDIYYSQNTSGPLVVMSHGFGSDRTFLTYLARHLASHGITVAAIEHPGSNFNFVSKASISGNPRDLISPNEFIDRPRDVSFLLDKLTQLNREPGIFQNKFNTQQTIALGHSLGGYTALALAGGELNLDDLRQTCSSLIGLNRRSETRQNNSTSLPLIPSPGEWLQCAAADLPEHKIQLGDRRVVSAIALNPVIGNLFGKTGLRKVTIPTLILASTEDAFTPVIPHQLEPFRQIGGNKYLLTAIGATHLSVGNPGSVNSQATILKERIGAEAEPIRRLVKGVSLAFVKQVTPEAKTYQPFLTPAYAQSLSTSQMSLRLNQELPPVVFQWVNLAYLP